MTEEQQSCQSVDPNAGPLDLVRYRNNAGWLANQDAFQVARSLCETRVGIRCALLCGSWVSGDARRGSDVDLYVLADYGPAFVREQLLFRGHPFQINTLTLDAAFNAISDGRAIGSPFYIHAFAFSEHIYGDRAANALIKDVAQKTLSGGPHPYSANRIEVARVATVNAWIKAANTTGTEGVLVAIRLFHNLLRYLQMLHGCWLFDDQWVARDSAFPADTLQNMTAALVSAVAGEPDAFLSLVSNLLDEQFLWTTRQPVLHRRAF